MSHVGPGVGHYVQRSRCSVCKREKSCHLFALRGKIYRCCGADCERRLIENVSIATAIDVEAQPEEKTMARSTPKKRAETHTRRTINSLQNLAKVKGLSPNHVEKILDTITNEVAAVAASLKVVSAASGAFTLDDDGAQPAPGSESVS